MAASYAVNAALIIANKKANVGEVNGHSKLLFDEIVGERAVYVVSDTIDIGAKLPKGARVTSAVMKVGATVGATGVFTFGYKASEEAVPLEAAASAGFITVADAVNAGGQAVQKSGTGAAIGKKFLSAVQPQITVTTATTAATGVLIQAWLHYTVD